MLGFLVGGILACYETGDFLAALAVLFIFMFSGAASLLLLPFTLTIRGLLLRGNHSRDAWGKVLTDLLGVAVLCSVSAQLVIDHQNREGSHANLPALATALFLFVFLVESSIDKRREIMERARKWTQHPECVSEIRDLEGTVGPGPAHVSPLSYMP